VLLSKYPCNLIHGVLFPPILGKVFRSLVQIQIPVISESINNYIANLKQIIISVKFSDFLNIQAMK
jgi:hypothetical protein